jgi:16S rRNA (uracil1498-N3)-methyltransferase
MSRFYIPPYVWNPDRLVLDPGESHHATDVLRLKEGDRLTIFNGEGAEATAEITSVKREGIVLRKIQVTKTPPLTCEITLGQAVPKGKNMELIIEKATELGASAIAPLLSERTVVQCSPDDALKKKQKWQRVAIEACKQCGQNWLPTVHTPLSPKAFFEAGHKFDLMLIASLQPEAHHLKQVLAEAGGTGPKRVLILVGPEGDFTPAEISLAKSHGCRPVTLGPIILRTETAALYCLSVLSHELLSGG